MATDNKKTPEQIAEERRSYVAGVMDPKTYGLTGAPLSTPGDVGEALTVLRSRGVNLLGPECRVDFLPRHHLVSLRWMFFDRMLPEPATNRAGPPGCRLDTTNPRQLGAGPGASHHHDAPPSTLPR